MLRYVANYSYDCAIILSLRIKCLFFRSLLKEQSRLNANSKMMPVMLYLRGISARGLNHVLDFVYKGSINLPQEELNDFLAVGESLQVSVYQI